MIREKAEQRGITALAVQPLIKPTTSQLSSTDIRHIMTGKQISVWGSLSDDAIRITIRGRPSALEEGLQLTHLLLRDARIDSTLAESWKNKVLQQLEDVRKRMVEGTRLILSGQDFRMARLTPEEVKARAAAIPEAQVWLDNILRLAPMEVAIVGHIPPERAIHLAAEYLGSLPRRPSRDSSLESLRQMPGFTGPLSKKIKVETVTPRAFPALVWRAAPWKELRRRRIMSLARRILKSRIRVRIRRELGLTYTAFTELIVSPAYPAISALRVSFTTNPDKISQAVATAKAAVEKFASEGPTDREMKTVRRQIRHDLEMRLHKPDFWVDLLTDLEYHNRRLESVVGLVDTMTSFTRQDILAEIQKVVRPENLAVVIATPKTIPSRNLGEAE